MKTTSIVNLVLMTVSTTLFSQNIDSKNLDLYFETLAANNKLMGSVAVFKDNTIIYKKAVGFKNVESKNASDVETKYKIGSISKTFTATLIFKAIEEKKLTLDTKLSTYFPQIKNAEKITIKNLLNHSSGIYSITNDEDYLSWNTKKWSEKDLVAKISGHESEFEPNSKNDYSNSNYILLSYILEKTFKKSYAEILDKYISKPLNLKNTYFGETLKTETNIAQSYTFGNVWNLETDTDPSVPLGAGGILSTPSDLLTFINALSNGKIVTKENLAQMTTFSNRYGLGLFEVPFETYKGWGHDGSIDGFRSIVTVFPAEKVSYAITLNCSNYSMDLVSKTVLNSVFNDKITIPEFKNISFTDDELNRLTGTYSGEGLPMKITITKEGMQLSAQATGQSAFPLEAIEKNVFTFDRAGIKLIFQAEKNTMILNQGGREFELKKE